MDDPKARRPVRIEDVAALAGVSTATVSRALSAPGRLRPATLARVEAAVRQVAYTPNLAARNLRARRSMLVLVVVPNVANPFFSEVLRGIGEVLTQCGYGLLIGDLGWTGGRPGPLLELVASGQADGVLLLNGAVPDDGGRRLTELGVPVVALCEAIPGADIPQVEAQNREAARAAVALLVSLGHRRLAYLAGPPGNILEIERRGGFMDGLADAGLGEADAVFWPGDFTFRAGEAAVAAFLAMARKPTALFAANDEMAISFQARVREAGVRVPDDISVIGFDGIEFCDYIEPRLSLGRAGAGLLVRAMAGETIAAAEMHVRLPVELVQRQSTAPHAGGHRQGRTRIGRGDPAT